MYYLIVVLCWTASVIAAPAPSEDVLPLEKQQPTVIPIVSHSEELEPNGTYKFSYETGNGIKREELSYDKILPKSQARSADSNEGGESSSSESDEIHVQQGSYSYTAPDGTLISLRYIADENGFQPIGDHIPKVLSASQSSSSSSNSGEKSGRALKKPADNAEAGSVPEAVVVGKAELRSALVSAPEPKTAESEAEVPKTPAAVSKPGVEPVAASAESSTAAAEVSTEAAKSPEALAESTTTEAVGLADSSTAEGAKRSESASAPSSSEASKATSESSSSPVEASTTEAASPIAAAA